MPPTCLLLSMTRRVRPVESDERWSSSGGGSSARTTTAPVLRIYRLPSCNGTSFALDVPVDRRSLRRGCLDLDFEFGERQPSYPDERHRRKVLAKELGGRAVGGEEFIDIGGVESQLDDIRHGHPGGAEHS